MSTHEAELRQAETDLAFALAQGDGYAEDEAAERIARIKREPVCLECKRPIPSGAPKVVARGGWVCQACVYAAERMRRHK